MKCEIDKHLVAHECDQLEIDSLFRCLPWCNTLVICRDRTITREEWSIQKEKEGNRRKKEETQLKAHNESK